MAQTDSLEITPLAGGLLALIVCVAIFLMIATLFGIFAYFYGWLREQRLSDEGHMTVPSPEPNTQLSEGNGGFQTLPQIWLGEDRDEDFIELQELIQAAREMEVFLRDSGDPRIGA
ncbi:hypothetical protein F5Y10DRAFT_265688 [Nemania abortiva]|nr:hypothetical protein F5Y10DRAFT_265688 [Nemania abortiva]